MEHEAASVNDVQWAQDTLQIARYGTNASVWSSLLYTAVASGLASTLYFGAAVLIGRAGWFMDRNPVGVWLLNQEGRFDLIIVAFWIVAGLLLRQLRARPVIVVSLLALQPLWLWLWATVIQVNGTWMGEGADPAAPYTVDFARFDATTISIVSISLGSVVCAALGYWVAYRVGAGSKPL